jgi:hypothetical protein
METQSQDVIHGPDLNFDEAMKGSMVSIISSSLLQAETEK